MFQDKTCNLNINLKAGIVQFSLADLCEKRKGCSIKSASISATEVSSILKPIDKPTDPLLSSTPKATESETVKPVDPAIISATEVSSSLKPTDKPTDPLLSSTPKATESETVKPVDPAIISATEVSSSLKPIDNPTDPLLSSTPKTTEGEPKDPVIGENGSSIASSTAPTSTITSSAESKDSSGITTTMSSLDKSSAGAHVNSEKSDSKFSGGVVFLLFLCGVVVGVLGFFMVIYIRKRYRGRSYETNDPPQEP
ncbi:PREDICTED: cell wall integrity and stress response component 4-like isoform X2 [Papilio xuthus]|uniref:Cell wall integrity and stress response component 4-like isoform X2 n=1 Tax=Papilio xuthus TaxID=66420 RepID=A0AAJ6Z465_PAPXU|nr:PREDICTED: cell wall integrity and stress response component 4-like isoform X2 [Papilio xuthus]